MPFLREIISEIVSIKHEDQASAALRREKELRAIRDRGLQIEQAREDGLMSDTQLASKTNDLERKYSLLSSTPVEPKTIFTLGPLKRVVG